MKFIKKILEKIISILPVLMPIMSAFAPVAQKYYNAYTMQLHSYDYLNSFWYKYDAYISGAFILLANFIGLAIVKIFDRKREHKLEKHYNKVEARLNSKLEKNGSALQQVGFEAEKLKYETKKLKDETKFMGEKVTYNSERMEDLKKENLLLKQTIRAIEHEYKIKIPRW